VKNYGVTTETFDVNCSIWELVSSAVADWVHYDGDNANAIGLTSPGTWEAAIRLTPTELAPYDGANLTTIMWHQGYEANPDTDVYNPTVKIYAGGTSDHPGSLIYNETFGPTSGTGWYNFTLSTPITIDASQDLWISIEVDDPGSGYYPQGVDAGPAVDGKGDWLSMDGGATWDELQNYGLDYNWNIRAFVEGGVTTYELIYYDEQTVTNLAPGEERYVEFTWPATPGDYIINVKTLLPGDVDPSNDEKEINVTITPADIMPPTSWIVPSNIVNGILHLGVPVKIYARDEDSLWYEIHYKVDGIEGVGEHNKPVDLGTFSLGLHTIEYWAIDTLGNEEYPHHVVTFYVTPKDGVTPALDFDGYHEFIDGVWHISPDTKISFDENILARNGITSVYYGYHTEGGENVTEWMQYTGPFTMPSGYYHLLYYGIDKIGYHTPTVVIRIMVETSNPPETSIILDPAVPDGNNGWYISNVGVSFVASDGDSNHVTTYYSIDGKEWQQYTHPLTLGDGVHIIKYYSIDENGNKEAVKTKEIKVDIYAPVITVEKPKNYLYIFDREIIPLRKPVIIGSITIKASIEDPATSGIDKSTLYIDGTPRQTFESSIECIEWQWNEFSFGYHTIEIKAMDKAGNEAREEMEALFFNL
ncbi:MAG: hypothetical protein FE044_04010, partial [Thermoplasmata archaeon]